MNKKSREKDKQDPLSKTYAFVDNGTLSSVCWDQACGTLIDLSHLRGRVFDGKTQSRRSSSTHVNVLDYFSRLLLSCSTIWFVTMSNSTSSSSPQQSALYQALPPLGLLKLQGFRRTPAPLHAPTLSVLKTARRKENSEAAKLAWVRAVVMHSLLSVKVCLGLVIFCVL